MVDIANPQLSINFAKVWYWGSVIGGLLLWMVICTFGVWIIYRWKSFKVPAEVFEIVGNVPVKKGNTKLREIIKSSGITKYEVMTWAGILRKKYREFYYHASPSYTVQSKKGIEFKLMRLNFNAYNPFSLTAFTNTIDKANNEMIKNAIEYEKKHEEDIKDPIKNNGFKKWLNEYNREFYTYIPISVGYNAAEMEVIPQNLLPTLANEVIETNNFYSEHKWWEPYIFPFSLMVFIIVQFLLVSWIMQHSAGVAAQCQAAKEGIVDTIKQKIL